MNKYSIKTISYGLYWVVAVAALNGMSHAASGEAVYKATCTTCHDSGAGQAPRIAYREDWAARWPRGRAALHESAIKGVPNSAMAPKGGYATLSDLEVKAAVDYMLTRSGYQEPPSTARPAAAPVGARTTDGAPLRMPSGPVDDDTLQTQIAEALRKALAPANARIEMVEGKSLVRGVNIRVSVRDSVVMLEGSPEKPDVIAKAEQIAKSFRSVQRVDNRMVAAGLLDFD